MKTIGLLLMLVLGVIATALFAQEARTPRAPRAGGFGEGAGVLTPTPAAPRVFTGPAGAGLFVQEGDDMEVFAPEGELFTMVGPRHQQSEKIAKALAAWKKAESESDRDDAREALHDALVEEYDSALEGYEKYLDDLSKRLEELREQVSERRSAKDKLVDLRLEMLINEAQGLGWPGDHGGFHFSMPGMNFMHVAPPSMPAPGVHPAMPAPPTAETPRAGGGGGGVR
jgi:hypothetical protein